MHRLFQRISSLLFAFFVIGASVEASSTPPKTFHRIMVHYEAIRLALLDDSLDRLAARAKGIDEVASELHGDLGCKGIVPKISEAAKKLGRASDLTSARTAFGELSKLLIQFREMVPGERPAVAYCPMVEKSWLQPKGEIGNPYMGKEMPRCGEIRDAATPAKVDGAAGARGRR